MLYLEQVFVSTRKGAQMAATTLSKEARLVRNSSHKQLLTSVGNVLRDNKLRGKEFGVQGRSRRSRVWLGREEGIVHVLHGLFSVLCQLMKCLCYNQVCFLLLYICSYFESSFFHILPFVPFCICYYILPSSPVFLILQMLNYVSSWYVDLLLFSFLYIYYFVKFSSSLVLRKYISYKVCQFFSSIYIVILCVSLAILS